MEFKEINNNRLDKLNNLWKAYENEYDLSPNLKRVIKRGFVCSEVLPEKNNVILVVGINPSFRKKEDNFDSYSFRFRDVCLKDQYYKKINNVIPLPSNYCIEYTDLFYLRQTEQASIHDFMNDEKGLKFMVNQLCITQDLIEELKPKLIVVFNKQAWNYWGINVKRNNGMLTNVWMGYEFEQRENHHIIKSLINDKERVNQSLKDTELIGTPIYFSKFLKYLSSDEINKIKYDLSEILKKTN